MSARSGYLTADDWVSLEIDMEEDGLEFAERQCYHLAELEDHYNDVGIIFICDLVEMTL